MHPRLALSAALKVALVDSAFAEEVAHVEVVTVREASRKAALQKPEEFARGSHHHRNCAGGREASG